MIERSAELTQTLVEVRVKLDAQLREHASTQRSQLERAEQGAASARARVAADMRRFEELLARASAAGLATHDVQVPPTDFGGQPTKLFSQMIERLAEAISAAEHTQTALAAERQRQDERRGALEQERQRRLAEEQRRIQDARRHDRLLTALVAACAAASLIAGIASGSLAGLLAPVLGTVVVSVAAAVGASTVVPRLGPPWAASGVAYGTGTPLWVGSLIAAPLFGVYALASLASGFSAQRFGISTALTLLFGSAQLVGRRRAR
jgi:hypothetical protein